MTKINPMVYYKVYWTHKRKPDVMPGHVLKVWLEHFPEEIADYQEDHNA